MPPGLRRGRQILAVAAALLTDALADATLNFRRWFLGLVIPFAATHSSENMKYRQRAKIRPGPDDKHPHPLDAPMGVNLALSRLLVHDLFEILVVFNSDTGPWAIWEPQQSRASGRTAPDIGLYRGDMLTLVLNTQGVSFIATCLVHTIETHPQKKKHSPLAKAHVKSMHVFLLDVAAGPGGASSSGSLRGQGLTGAATARRPAMDLRDMLPQITEVHQVLRAPTSWAPQTFGKLADLLPWQVACLLGKGALELDTQVHGGEPCPWAFPLAHRCHRFLAKAHSFLQVPVTDIVGNFMAQEVLPRPAADNNAPEEDNRYKPRFPLRRPNS